MDNKEELLEHHKDVFKSWMIKYFGTDSPKELAEEIDSSRFTIMKWISGTSFSSYAVLQKLKAKFPQIDMNELYDLHYNGPGVLKEEDVPYGERNNLIRETELLREQVDILKDHINTLKAQLEK